MPTGIVIDSAGVLLGGLLGSVFGKKLSADLKAKLNMIFGLCSLVMGIGSVILMKNMPAVILAVILGTILGVHIRLEEKVHSLGKIMVGVISRDKASCPDLSMLSTVIVLFCVSGTGIYGALVSGMTGEHTILISKAILDFFTAAIFACLLGKVVAVIALPQFVLLLTLFMCARWIFPLTTGVMIADFKACGGFLMIATGFRMLKLKDFPTADMIPAMILAFPFSALWTNMVLPLLN